MSVRRQARGRSVVTGPGGIPRVFLLGPCTEVWAESDDDDDLSLGRLWDGRHRFLDARKVWLDRAGITSAADGFEVIPETSPYCVAFLRAHGRGEHAEERFAAAGCSTEHIAQLRREARVLSAAAGVR